MPQVAQQKVNVQTALVRLVNDDGVVSLKQRIVLGFGQQNAVGHELDARGFAQPILKPDFVAHHFTQWGLQLFGNALGHRTGCNTPWLCVPDKSTSLNRLSARLLTQLLRQRQDHFGKLRGFTGTGFTTHNDHLVGLQRRHDFLAAG